MTHYEATPDGPVVSVRPFPDVTRSQVSIGPGLDPVFSSQGTEIFFFENGRIVAAPVQLEPALRIGAPRPVVEGAYWYGAGGEDGSFGRAWDPHPDGERFLMILPPEAPTATQDMARLHVVVNWLEELEARRTP